MRMIKIVQLPLGFLRALTVPLPEKESWSRSIIVLHPPCCSVFLIYLIFGPESDSFGALLAIFVPLSVLLSAILYFSIHEAQPPTSKIAKLSFAFISFAMCVLWIFAVASEIVALFNSFGTIFGANSSIIGISFLAWGNSIGDLVTNVAIARGGMPAMGVAACVASPVFNMLFGLGASLTLVALKQYPNPVPISLDVYTKGAATVCFLVLSMTFLVARFNGNKLNRLMGFLLCGAYFIYIASLGLFTAFS